ncbi:RsmB/NOP family class I SAM-dependent RNA methyltransferase [Aurantiacibacter spongiae]|uniref:RsmB/NOP family class I SAM-dependent RNA methyltransferase n=1 Tax=Aurantiacibacter spongiae TaxID=2488860 RepID=A0A3N5CPN3_9SPHN|nr:RsmB/NOP family class I SAM-dependent RNA methyltransferase [Aurantiacibacter spongiae]RPF70537.1 RsmB/NOP family class I SAM-dependent RNA methyltransferase [Aurantiacibacter spongiae]
MRDAARLASAIEILDTVISAARSGGAPADRILADWFRSHRFAGSKDKHAIRELVYDAIRACGPVPPTGRAAMVRLSKLRPELRDLFDGSQYGAAPIDDGEQSADGGIAPHWLEQRLAASDVGTEAASALLGRAPLDLRVNALKSSREGISLPESGEKLAAPHALRFPTGTRADRWKAYEQGFVEIQDHGSQLACLATEARPGECVIDLCAGAGGKTLALAAAMDNRGTLVAADTDRGRLSRLGPRAERAGARIADTVLLDPGKEMQALSTWKGAADRVIIDAPCSGMGTWRRNPEARWRLGERELERLAALQQRLLGVAADLVKPGGVMTYVTCSLLDEEGAVQIDRFLAGHPDWTARRPDLPLGQPRGKGVRLTPSRDGTDGFFIACLCRA